MVDPARVLRLLDRLGREIGELRRLSGYEPRDLLSDRDRLNSVKYEFVVAIETCTDVASHVIASESLRAPESVADAFVVLGEAGILDERFARGLAAMARFRNLLVHQYAEVDDGQVVEILHTRLDDLDRFREAMADLASGSE
jgi:uncharacterized protein YutE (UPF0331/DUF86 family)